MPVRFRRLTSESFAFAFLIGGAAVMVAGYAVDLSGLKMYPALLALVAVAGAVAGLLMFHDIEGHASGRETAVFVAVVGLSWIYLLWLASPSFLPVTIGPDVVHHLQLIHLIQHTHRLVHDPALSSYLLEMTDYTPGSHILAATVADWLNADALRILLPLTALVVSIKFGLLYLVAARATSDMTSSSIAPVAAPILALAPAVYTLGSFFHFFFYAQVVAETFAVGMLLATEGWRGTGRRAYLWAFALCAVGAFLSWPPWIGIGCATLLFCVVRAPIDWSSRLRACAVAFAPLAVVAGVHTILHASGSGILTASGAVTAPSIAACGAAFLACALVGALVSARRVAAAPVVVFLALTVVQATALAALGALAHARGYYMPFKMVYLAVLPCAVLGAVALVWFATKVLGRVPRVRALAAAFPVLIAIAIIQGRVPRVRSTSPIQDSTYMAGIWTRDHLNPACVDYFSRHWLTGYWLHLDVLGNPRLSDRMRAESFELRDVVGRWIEGRGMPYGIVEDLSEVPNELRSDLTVLQTFGSARVVRNNHPVPCQ